MSHEWLCRAREMSRVEVVVKVVFSIGEEKAQLKRATNSRAGEARKASTQLLVFLSPFLLSQQKGDSRNPLSHR